MKIRAKIGFLIILVIAAGAFLYFNNPQKKTLPSPQQTSQAEKVTVIIQGLDTPWGMAFLPDGGILVTERAGRVRLIDRTGNLQQDLVTLENVREIGEGGLLGIALDPDFSSNRYVYLYYTYLGNGNNTLNRVVRMIYEDNQLKDEQIIVDKIPGAPNHNGGRIKFGPDKLLYITTGDAQNPSQSQDINSLAGKILRVKDLKAEVYSYGHRNAQGLAWDSQGRLWSTEHGRSALDELNLIEKGKNYGWPVTEGSKTAAGMEIPRLHSGSTTWAPAGVAFKGNSLLFGGLRGETLYEAVLERDQITLKEHFKGEFGRIRDVVLGPDNLLYISTSNKDGRGNPRMGDDKVIRINSL